MPSNPTGRFMSSVTAVRIVVEHFGRLFLKVTNTLTATVTFGLPTKQSFLKKLIVALGKTLGKPIMSNDGITLFDNDSLATPVKHCLFQSPMNTMLGSPICLLENTIPFYHFDFYHYQKILVLRSKVYRCIWGLHSIRNIKPV